MDNDKVGGFFWDTVYLGVLTTVQLHCCITNYNWNWP